MNTIKQVLTLNGKDVNEVNAEDMTWIFFHEGYTDCGIKQVKFLKITEDRILQFLVFSYDNNEDCYYISKAFITEDSADFDPLPIKEFDGIDKENAMIFFNKYSE